jgi:S1-C subfamily serine protease
MQRVRLPDNLKTSLGLDSAEGLIVVSVEQDGPADKAGVLVGDVIVALDGKPVSSTDDVQAILDPERVGKPIGVAVVRGGSRTDLQVTVGERPQRGT